MMKCISTPIFKTNFIRSTHDTLVASLTMAIYFIANIKTAVFIWYTIQITNTTNVRIQWCLIKRNMMRYFIFVFCVYKSFDRSQFFQEKSNRKKCVHKSNYNSWYVFRTFVLGHIHWHADDEQQHNFFQANWKYTNGNFHQVFERYP